MEWPAAALILVAGGLIGATGIGGLLVAPVLMAFEAVELSHAIAASAAAFAVPGAVALWRNRRLRATVPHHLAPDAAAHQRTASASPGAPWLMIVAALPGALLGAWAVHQVHQAVMIAGIGLLAAASGVKGLLRHAPVAGETAGPPLTPLAAQTAGFFVGAGSALTGTGGPMLLVPLLLMLHQPLRHTVAAGQMIQLPIAVSAALAHAGAGKLDWLLTGQLCVLLLAGSLAGQAAAQRMPVVWLARFVNALLVAAGLWYLRRAVFMQFSF